MAPRCLRGRLLNSIRPNYMSAFPVTKTPTLASYVSILRAIGAPVDAGLRRARLPTLFEEIPDAWLPYERLRYFTVDMAEREGISALGLIPQVSDTQTALSRSFRGPVLSAPTLLQALQRLPSLTSRQTTDIRSWIEPIGDLVRFCLVLPLPLDVPGYDIGETRTLRLMEHIVGAFAGPDFVPTRVLLASRARDLRFNLQSAYGDIPVLTDQPCGAIEFPRALLSCTSASADAPRAGSGAAKPDDAPPGTLSETLEACLEPYLLEGYPHVALAAEIVGCNVRSLQRKLTAEQNTYSEVVDNVRCRAAMSRLRDSELNLNQIAQRLGYSEHSAFTRAFRRWTGTTPNDYQARVENTPTRPNLKD
jgi:AraC-like DNA-binding protein